MTDGPGRDPYAPPLPPASFRARPRPSDADRKSIPSAGFTEGDFEAFARCAGYRFERADNTFANQYGLSHRHTPSRREAIHDRAMDSGVRLRLRGGLRRITQSREG